MWELGLGEVVDGGGGALLLRGANTDLASDRIFGFATMSTFEPLVVAEVGAKSFDEVGRGGAPPRQGGKGSAWDDGPSPFLGGVRGLADFLGGALSNCCLGGVRGLAAFLGGAVSGCLGGVRGLAAFLGAPICCTLLLVALGVSRLLLLLVTALGISSPMEEVALGDGGGKSL